MSTISLKLPLKFVLENHFIGLLRMEKRNFIQFATMTIEQVLFTAHTPLTWLAKVNFLTVKSRNPPNIVPNFRFRTKAFKAFEFQAEIHFVRLEH